MDSFLATPNSVPSVDSREVAEMVGKRHDHLLRDINGYVEIMQKSTAPNFGVRDFFIPDTYRDSTGRKLPCYLVTRKGCDMVANKMTGEKGVLFTAMYVTRFEDMEKKLQNRFIIPQTLPEALRLAADLAEQNALMAPKAAMHDLFLSAGNNQTMNDVAKTIGVGRNKLFALLRDKSVLRTNNTPYQRYIDAGYFVVKEKTITMGDQAINKPQTFVTARGVDWLGRLLRKNTSLQVI